MPPIEDTGGHDMRTIIALTALTLLTGCASAPSLNFSPANIGMSRVKQNAALMATTVTVANKSEALGKIAITGGEAGVAMLWKTSLDDSITRMAIFRDDAPLHLSLAVKILKLDMPAMGMVMVTQTVARYELIDRNTGAIVFTTDVTTEGRSPVSDNFQGAIRARISAANSVQNNIAEFLRQLESADLSKPMFPGGTQVQSGGAAK